MRAFNVLEECSQFLFCGQEKKTLEKPVTGRRKMSDYGIA